MIKFIYFSKLLNLLDKKYLEKTNSYICNNINN